MDMVFRSCVYSVVSGAVLGVLYALGIWIIRIVASMFCKHQSSSCEAGFKGGIVKNIFDFVIVILMGISQLLSNYVLLDGAFSIYTALISVLVFLFFKSIFLGAFEQSRKC